MFYHEFEEDLHNQVYELIKNWKIKGKQPFEFSNEDASTLINSEEQLREINPAINFGTVLTTLISVGVTGMMVKNTRRKMIKKVLNYLFDIGLDYIPMESLINQMRIIDIENGDMIVSETGLKIKTMHIVVEEWFIEQLIEEEFIDIDEKRNVCISDNGIMELKKINYVPEYESKEIKVAGYTRKDGRKVNGYSYKRKVLKNKPPK